MSRKRRQRNRINNNNNISKFIFTDDVVPDEFKCNDKYLDIVTMNVHDMYMANDQQLEITKKVLKTINADIFVLQECDSDKLGKIVYAMNREGAGNYKFACGTKDPQRKVAILWDEDWVSPVLDFEIKELFSDNPQTPDNRDIFPRYPLCGYFIADSAEEGKSPFDFFLVGVHLKSMRQGEDETFQQRKMAGDLLSQFIEEYTQIDKDIIICGDWNNTPDKAEWDALKKMERDGKIHFGNWNPNSDATIIAYNSRIDLIVATIGVDDYEVKGDGINGTKVIQWGIDKTQWKSVSDHLPVISRFYFSK